MSLPDEVAEDRARPLGSCRIAVHRGARQNTAAEAPAIAASETPAAAASAPGRRCDCEDILCRFPIAPPRRIEHKVCARWGRCRTGRRTGCRTVFALFALSPAERTKADRPTSAVPARGPPRESASVFAEIVSNLEQYISRVFRPQRCPHGYPQFPTLCGDLRSRRAAHTAARLRRRKTGLRNSHGKRRAHGLERTYP